VAKTADFPNFDYTRLAETLSIFHEWEGEEADFSTGPVFAIWGLRDPDSVDEDAVVFSSKRQSSFCFKQKHMHFLAVGDRVTKAMTNTRGNVLSAFEIGSVAEVSKFIERVDARFDDSYVARYVAAPRGQDALALSSDDRHVFIPIRRSIGGDLGELSLGEYIEVLRTL
jgi:hypothetical protein